MFTLPLEITYERFKKLRVAPSTTSFTISVFQTPAKTYSRSEQAKQHQNKSGIETGCEVFCFSFLLTGKCETKCTSTIACDRVQGRVG